VTSASDLVKNIVKNEKSNPLEDANNINNKILRLSRHLNIKESKNEEEILSELQNKVTVEANQQQGNIDVILGSKVYHIGRAVNFALRKITHKLKNMYQEKIASDFFLNEDKEKNKKKKTKKKNNEAG